MGSPSPTFSFSSGKPGKGILAGGLFVFCLVLYASTLQGVLYGDGIFYLTLARDVLAGKAHPVGHHPLYLPVLCGFLSLAGKAGLTPIQGGALLSALSVSGGVVFTFLLLDDWLAENKAFALFGALLLALTPTTWFFATTTENHGLHFFFAALLLLGMTKAARKASPLAPLLPGILYVPAFLSHTTALMLAPFLATAFLVFRAETGLPMPWRKIDEGRGARLRCLGRTLAFLFLLLGPVAATRLLLPRIYTLLGGGVNPFHGLDPSAATLATLLPKAGVVPGLAAWLFENPLRLSKYTLLHAGSMLAYVRDDWLYHSAAAGILFLLGWIPMLKRSLFKGAPWGFLPALAFFPYAWIFSFWGFRPVEKGAYYLPVLPVLVGAGLLGILSLGLPWKKWKAWILLPAAALLALQGGLARSLVSRHARVQKNREWAEDAAGIARPRPGAPGFVLTGDGHRLYFLRYFHARFMGAFQFEDFLPAYDQKDPGLEKKLGEKLAALVKQYHSRGSSIFLDDLFLEKAEKHPAFWKALEKLGWKKARRGLARGLLLDRPPSQGSRGSRR